MTDSSILVDSGARESPEIPNAPLPSARKWLVKMSASKTRAIPSRNIKAVKKLRFEHDSERPG
jgi:hypothetical protein